VAEFVDRQSDEQHDGHDDRGSDDVIHVQLHLPGGGDAPILAARRVAVRPAYNLVSRSRFFAS
jgi:hypothetical protein